MKLRKGEVDIALHSLAVSDLLREEIDSIVFLWKQASETYDASISKYSSMIIALSGIDQSAIDWQAEKVKQDIVRADYEEVIAFDKKVKNCLEGVITALESFDKKSSYLLTVTRFAKTNAHSELAALTGRFNIMKGQFFAKRKYQRELSKELTIKIDEYRRRINELAEAGV